MYAALVAVHSRLCPSHNHLDGHAALVERAPYVARFLPASDACAPSNWISVIYRLTSHFCWICIIRCLASGTDQ
ncbi:hypothetical protein T02_12514 [Trichinella nativa]|uniref:Uncharacterized protein n=1 Tax=Trichinella nativa TaxID=6335 RepID=A0A0V1LAI5_9BILA|nr:hypothetical protein T02_12514 [Trichinella nativa]